MSVKGSAARRARFIQKDIIDRLIADLEAFDVLTADINDEIYVWIVPFGRRIMGNRLYDPEIGMECIFYDFLAVAGRSAGKDAGIRKRLVQLFKKTFRERDRVAGIGHVTGKNDLALLVDGCRFQCCRTGIDPYAQADRLLARGRYFLGAFRMFFREPLVFLSGFEERLAGRVVIARFICSQRFEQRIEMEISILRKKSGSIRNKIKGMFRTRPLQRKRLIERFSQLRKK